jgi:anti-sigma factor RsiW
MDHARVQERLDDYDRGRLDAATRAELEAHLAGCATCRQAAAVEAALTGALARGLPRHAPTPDFRARLRRRLAETTGDADATAPAPGAALAAPRASTAAAATPPRRARSLTTPLVSAVAAAVIVFAIVRLDSSGRGDGWDLVDEAVTDHLRVVTSTHPLEIESGGIHQVKPWFTGRLDFAPRIAFEGDADFPLLGGSVAYVHDRKAAVFQFRRRLHAVTLLVFPWAGLPWPEREPVKLGTLSVVEQTVRGFSALLWRKGDLGYALVSDANRADLEGLAPRIDPE